MINTEELLSKQSSQGNSEALLAFSKSDYSRKKFRLMFTFGTPLDDIKEICNESEADKSSIYSNYESNISSQRRLNSREGKYINAGNTHRHNSQLTEKALHEFVKSFKRCNTRNNMKKKKNKSKQNVSDISSDYST